MLQQRIYRLIKLSLTNQFEWHQGTLRAWWKNISFFTNCHYAFQSIQATQIQGCFICQTKLITYMIVIDGYGYLLIW